MDYRDVIGRAVVFIENNLYEPLNAAMVADAVSYSYYHFHRHFLSVMGETVGAYMRSRRLTLAASELVHSDKSILDIAISLHFESAEGFARAFRKKYRMSPREYRKQGIDVLIASHPPLAPHEISACVDMVPEIVSVPTRLVVGMSYTMSVLENQAVAMWEKLDTILSSESVDCFSGARYCFYENEGNCQRSTFREDTAVSAFIGVEQDLAEIPEGLEKKCFAGGTYAKFIHRGSVDTLESTYRYIWGVWFPQSGYELGDGDDFERYAARFIGPFADESETEIYFPLQIETA